jgi:serine/threonine protein kinase
MLKELESSPETLLQSLQSLQSTVGHTGAMQDVVEQQPTDTDSSQAGNESVGPIDAALEKVKRLIDAPRMAADEKAKAAWQPALKELGIYDLIRPLGRGGMGAVYLAVHRQLRKQVAIKLLPLMSGEDSDVRARFEREIRVVGKLNHPSIVAATDAGEIDGIQFLVMEYVPGLDLSRLARLIGRLSVADSCELIRQVALGLSCAHAEGVVHRDVKPSNLMLDESGRIRILDFGLAQLSVWDEASVDLTTVGQLMGTLDYMAPEQAELSGNVDYRADLYALGATLFRLLCGRPPLAAAPNQSPLEKLRLLANHQPPSLKTLCPEAPPELVQLVSSMLARNPSDRPASAAHVAEQLASFVAGSRLVELLETAKQKAASTPEQVKKSLLGEVPVVLPTAHIFSATSAPALQPANVNNGRGRLLHRFMIAAALPLLVLAGILIKLEVDKGQLIIESDVDNVHVKVLRQREPVAGIQISHGATSTRLQADRYEITIDGPSDGLVIDKNEFTLKSGETVVARIRRSSEPRESSNSLLGPSPAAEARLKRVAASLVALSAELDKTIGQWKGRDPLSGVVWESNRFRSAAMLLEQLQSTEHSPADLEAQTARVFEAWKQVYVHLVQSEGSQREQLSQLAGKIASDLKILSELVREAASQSLISQDDSMSAFNRKAPGEVTDPLYEGKPLEYWQDMLGREKSAAGLLTAFDACSALVTDENGEQIANVVLKVVPKLPGDMYLEAGRNMGSGRTVDSVALPLLRAALPGSKYFSRWVAEFEIGETAWRERLWKSYMYVFISRLGPTDISVQEVEPFVAWAEKQLQQNRPENKDVDQDCLQAADQLRQMIGTYSSLKTEAFRNRVMGILTSSTQLPVSWWLSQPLIYRNGDTHSEIWPSEFKVEVTRRAIEALQSDETPQSLVVQASIILAYNIDVTAEQRQTISEAINRRLEALAKDRTLLTQMVPTSQEFTNYSVPGLDIQSPLHLALLQIQISVRHGVAREVPGIDHSVALTLLNHAWKIDKGASAKPQLEQIFRSIYATFERIRTQSVASATPGNEGRAGQRGVGRSSGPSIQLQWPSLQTGNVNQAVDQFGNSARFQELQTATLWGKHEPTKLDWLEYFILLHPAMTERVTQAVKEFPVTHATEAAPVEKTE